MADTKLSALTELAVQPAASDEFYVNDGGVSKRIQYSTLLNGMTLVAPKIATGGAIVDAGADEYVVFTEAATPVTYIGITSGNTGVAPRVSGAGETNTDLHLLGTGTGNVYISDGTDPTKDINFELSGATTAKTMTITSSHTDDRTLTLPDATDTLVGKATTDTLTNKTLTLPKIVTTGAIVDGGGDEYLVFTEAATPVTYIGITSGNTGVAPRVQGAGETNTDLHLLGSGTGNVFISDGTDPTKDLNFELSGATTVKTMTIISSHTDDRSLTLPDATDTLVGKATTDTLTNKTLTNPSLTLPRLSVAAGVTADVGSAQGGGAITTDIVQIATCANAGDAVTLPTAVAGLKVHIINNGAQACDVFPAASDNLGAGVDTAASLAAGANITYIAYDATNWFAAT